MKLEDFIYYYNLFSTSTIKNDYPLSTIDLNRENYNANYENSICLIEIVNLFHQKYKDFYREYLALPKLDLGEINFLSYHQNIQSNYDYRHVVFEINNPKIEDVDNREELVFNIISDNNKISTFLSNYECQWDKNYYRKNISVDMNYIHELLDLFSKYSLFLDAYKDLKKKMNSSNNIFFTFSIDGVIPSPLTKLEISFGFNFVDCNNLGKIIFQLDDSSIIDYDNSQIIIDDSIPFNKKEIVDKLINGIYINRSCLSAMFSIENQKKLRKIIS